MRFTQSMKATFIILVFCTFFHTWNDRRKILCSHPWKVDYIKTLQGTNKPLSTKQILEIDSTPPKCGQIISFKQDNTCEVKNKGNGFWSDIDKSKWSLDDMGNIRFRNTDPRLQPGFALIIRSINNDSIIFYIESWGIESGKKLLTVHKLGRVK